MDELQRQLARVEDCLTRLESLVHDAETIDLISAMRADFARLECLLTEHLRHAGKP